MIQKILVAVDGSENSIRALDFALEFSERYNATLTVVNVSESSTVAAAPSPQIAAYSGDSGSMVIMERDMRKFHEEILDKALAYAKKAHPGLSVTTILREGDPALEIAALAKDGDFDVVVVGHRGTGKISELFLGNISERLAHMLSCTVVIVR
jgi:nucleotide-binding universal stress UspA family protein